MLCSKLNPFLLIGAVQILEREYNSSNFRRVWSMKNINLIFHLDYDSVFNEVDHTLLWVNDCKGNYYSYYEL